MAGKACLKDLWPTEDGKILVGEHVIDGFFRHIDEVERGLACRCICFGCRRRLVAKKGEARIKAYHFAHEPDGLPDCGTTGESRLHRYAKQIIEKHGKVRLPSVELFDHLGTRRRAASERVIELTDVKLETFEGEVIPDIVAFQPDGRRLFIEICNFHQCPPEKLAKLRAMDVDVLEIYVSDYRSTLLTELDDVIIHSAPRKLLQCKTADILRETLQIEKQAADRREAEATNRQVAAYRDNRHSSHITADDLANEFVHLGLSDEIDMDDTIPSAFIVPRRQWQAAVLFRFLDADTWHKVFVLNMLKRFDQRGWVKRELYGIKSQRSQHIAASQAPEFRSPFEEILGYLARLDAAGIAIKQSAHCFVARTEWLQKVNGAVAARTRSEERRDSLEKLFHSLGQMMLPSDGNLPDVDRWLAKHADQRGVSSDVFLKTDDGDVDDLIDTLTRLIDEIGDPAKDAPEFLLADIELPVETLMWRVRDEYYRDTPL